MSRIVPLVACLLLPALAAGQPPAAELPLDLITLTDGTKLKGLVVEEQQGQVQFQYLSKKPGMRSLVHKVVYDRVEIASIVKAPEPGRSEALRVFDALQTAKSREEAAARQLKLEEAPWVISGVKSWQYRGPFFTLQSDAEESFVRLVCVRLNEIFAAYVSNLPTRVPSPKPTRILMFRSLGGFYEYQIKRDIRILNPAVYDAKTNEITVGCDLERLDKLLEDTRRKHQGQLKDIAEQRRRLDEHYKGQPPPAQVRQLWQARSKIRQADADNAETFTRLEGAFFATLYHEAFHAYLDNAVYPSAQFDVPRWLNEGLAQLFENAFVEIGELRVGRIDERRLQDIQDAVQRGRFMTLREILQAPPQQFFVRHTQEKFEADRQYDAAWALAHYLKNGLKILEPPAVRRLTEYVSQPRPTGQELAAFERLVGKDLDTCEKEWRDYLLRLRVDGTLRP